MYFRPRQTGSIYGLINSTQEPLDSPEDSLLDIPTVRRNIACAGSLPLGSGAANVPASQPGENVEAGHRAQIHMSDIRSGESPGDCLPVRRERACEDYRGTVRDNNSSLNLSMAS